MANKRIAGITVEIGADTTKLGKALNDIEKDSRNIKTELREVNNALRLDPTNTELLAQKQQLLSNAIQNAKEKLDTLKAAQQSVEEQFRKGEIDEGQYRAFQREIINTENELQRLEDEADETASATSELGESVDSTGDKFKNFGDKISGAGEKMLPITKGIVDLGKNAVTTAADFDASMSKVAAVSGATGEDFDKLREKAREMGANTKFSASEAADAMNYMAMAGWKTNDMLEGVEGIMNLAAASGEDLATTSDIVTDALTALGMKAGDAGHFADVLAAASSNANTNVSILGESFKYVAPVAGSMGASAEDLSIALGLMANSGIKGSQAGNSLKNALVNLTKPTKEQANAMAKLGFIATETIQSIDFEKVEKAEKNVELATLNLDNAQIKLNDAIEKYGANSSQAQTASNNYEKNLIKLTEAQENLAKEQEGVSETVKKQNTLMVDEYGNMRSLGGVMDELRSKMGQLNVELVDSNGNAREYDDIMADLSKTSEGLAQAEQMQAAATIFGKQNMAGMLAIINASEEDYNSLTEAIYNCEDSAKNMSDVMQDNLKGQLEILKSQLAELAISFGDMLMPIIRKVVSVIQNLTDKLNKLSPAQKEMILKIAAVVAAIGPALIIVGKIVSLVGTAINVVTKVKDAITVLNTVLLANPIAIVIAAIAAVIAILVTLYKNSEDFRKFVDDAFDSFKVGIKICVDFFEKAVDSWKTGIKMIMDFFKKAVDNWKTGIKMITDFFKNAVDTWKSGIRMIVDFFQDAVNTWKAGINAIKEGFTNAWNGIKAVWNGAVEFFSGVRNGINNAFENVGTWFHDKFHEAFERIKDVFSGIRGFFEGIWNTITDVFGSVGTRIGDAFGGAFKSVVNTVFEWIENRINDVFDMINGAIDFINEIPGVELSKINHVSLPRLAKGGVLSEGSAIVAEAGPELLSVLNGKVTVTPLTGSARNTESGNTATTNNYYQTVNLQATINNDMDIRELSQKLGMLNRHTAYGKGG